jgi:CheY-like chemotaxis protein
MIDKATPILVVDDNADLLEAYKELLTLSGYQVVVASSGAEALTILAQLRPGLLLTDLSMPEMDGFELIQRMRSQLQDAAPPAIVCSGFTITEEEALHRGARLFLAKPVDPRTLLASIEGLLHGRGPDRRRMEEERRRMSATRYSARLAARQRATQIARSSEASLAGPWLEWLRTYFDCAWSGAFLVTSEGLDLLTAAGHPATDVLLGQPLRLNLQEVIETGSSLVIADAKGHPTFHFEPTSGAEVRFFVGVPLLSPDDVAIGALCLADPDARRCHAETLVILEHFGRRGALLLSPEETQATKSERRTPPLLMQRSWETLVDMESRIANRESETLQLGIIELSANGSPRELAQALWRISAYPRLAIGSLGPGRVGVCLRGAPPGVSRHLAAGIEVLGQRGLVDAAGFVSVTQESGLSAPALLRIAEGALLTAQSPDSPSRLEEIQLGSLPTA